MITKVFLRDYSDDDIIAVEKITESIYFDKFKEFDKNTIKIILSESAVVGWAHIHIPNSSLYSGFIFIYVAPEYRRKGIGTWVYRQAESKMIPVGCNWWTSYPESKETDRFVLSIGFDYTNTNSYMVFNGNKHDFDSFGIRPCRLDDYPTAPDIWSREYADMHKRIGIPYHRHELTEDERQQEYEQFSASLHNSYVFEINGKIIGYGTLFDDNSGIGSVAVDRAYAGRGYGTKLAAFLTNECIKRGNMTPCLYCESGNDDAMHVYRKIGYTEVSRETVAIKNK